LKIPYFRPDFSRREAEAAAKAIESGWVSTGPEVAKFEENFSKFLSLESASNANAVCSATAGLHLALEAVGADNETEIFIPTMTFTATAEVATYVKSKIHLVDSEADNPNISIEKLTEAVNISNAKKIVIMPVHFGGVPVDIDKIMSKLNRKVMIVEDAAHAFPAKFLEKYVGESDSDAIVFSFYANKTITTGEGGMVVSRKNEISKRIRLMKSHGIDRVAFDRFQGSSSASWEYDVIAAGFKYNLSDVLASIGNIQLEKAILMQERRSRIAQIYDTGFANIDVIEKSKRDLRLQSSHHIYSIEISNKFHKSRDEVANELNTLGIGTSLHYKPLHLMTFWKKSLNANVSDYPNANKRYQSSISLPIYSNMKDSEIEYVVEQVTNILK
jgi:dTDP-4-amino-4,6-dideoxygalactose transaminase